MHQPDPVAAGVAVNETDRVLVRTVSPLRLPFDSPAYRAINRTGAVTIEPVTGLDAVHVLTFASHADATAAVSLLDAEPAIAWAEPDHVFQYSFDPGDPLMAGQLWVGAIDLPAAWKISTGDPSIVVAVVDSGVSSTHPDLAGKLLPGYDFLHNDTDPSDDVGHGTAVAGIIGARGEDGLGIAGIAMDTTILPVKVGSADGSPISAIASGIVWAVDQGAHVINLSLGSDFPSDTLHEAVRYAYEHNVPVVTAAGNDPEAISHPGAYPESISVGASTAWGSLTGFTTRANRVDLVAPGSGIITAWAGGQDGDTWASVTGTSFAAPMVTGVVALLKAVDPSLTVEELRALLTEAAVQIGAPEPGSGAGQLDAGATLATFVSRAFESTWRPADGPVASGVADRTWVWGPNPIATGFEEYDETATGQRLIRYYDKARMEINDPAALGSDPWAVTNGLLAQELISGRMQVGDHTFVDRAPAGIVVAGDWGDSRSPTYADFTQRLHSAPARAGSTLVERMDSDGIIRPDQRFAGYGVHAAWFVQETNHQIASVFWSYLNSEGLLDLGGELELGPIFDPVFYATGLPITEAYWVEVPVNGVLSDVLVQCFERRCLTYTPDNPENWKVEMGNIGQHYFNWRYSNEIASVPPTPPRDRTASIGWVP